MKSDPSLLQAALIGYESQLAKIEEAMADLRRRIKTGPDGGSAPASSRKRILSAGARRRIAAAQKKRWAAYKKAKAEKSR